MNTSELGLWLQKSQSVAKADMIVVGQRAETF